MDLSQVSRTAILTLICRTVAFEKDNTVYDDPMAVLCLDRLISASSAEDRQWIIRQKRKYAGIQRGHAEAGARRAKVFDVIADRFIASHPCCTVINLACGFDTRFWRIKNENCRYIELDLPEVIQLKKEILKDHLCYDLIGRSVLDTAWIDQVTAKGNTDFLLIAEGLFMWFSKQENARMFKEIGEKFYRSQLVLDMVPEKWMKGIWKIIIDLETRLDWGLDVSWAYGIKDSRDLEAFSDRLKVTAEEPGSAGPIITVSINAS